MQSLNPTNDKCNHRELVNQRSDLIGCHLEIEQVSEIVNYCPNLTWFKVAVKDNFSEKILQPLAKLEKLETLILYINKGVLTNKLLEPLKDLNHLTILNIYECAHSSGTENQNKLSLLESFKSLKILVVKETMLNGVNLSPTIQVITKYNWATQSHQ